ncbi:TPA: hypothetical protein ACH0TZ_001234 [Citrobacter werkmanii]
MSIDVEGRNYYLYVYYFIYSVMLAVSIKKIKLEYNTSFFLLAISCCWMIVQIFRFGYNPEAFNGLIDGSRNYISAYLIIFYIYYMYAAYINGRTVSLIYPIFIVVACIFLYGRSGIILSLLVFLVSLLQSGSRVKIGFFIVCSLIGIAIFYNQIVSIVLNSNLSHGVETERSGMLEQYFFSIQTARDLLFGVDLFECCSLIRKFDGNPHNSFIMMHSRFGLFPFLIIIGFYVFQIIKGILLKKIYLNLLLLIIFMRYFLDTIGFFGPVDFILFTIAISILRDQMPRREI